MKAISLPPWKMNEKTVKNEITKIRTFHKFLITLFLAIEEDDMEREKLKNVKLS